MATYDYNKKYAEKYLKELDDIKIRVPKGTKDIWKAAADRAGISMTQYVRLAVETAIERDKANT